MLVSRAFLYISFRDPGRGAVQIVTHLSKSPGSTSGTTYGEKYPFPEHSFTYPFTQGNEDPSFRSTDPNLSPLFCPRAVCRPDRPLDIHRSFWAMNSVFPGKRNSHIKQLIYDNAVDYSSAMQRSQCLPPWLGKTRTPLASKCHGNPVQGIPSTPVNTSSIAQGTARGWIYGAHCMYGPILEDSFYVAVFLI
jgi:hypothetical protein